VKPTIQAVTISVSNLEASKRFYEEVLGFEPDLYYEPTRWQSYHSEGRAFLGIAEVVGYHKAASLDIINFDIEDIEAYWAQVKGQVDVEAPLEETPWGSYKFVIRDPDGNRLGFVGKQ
jgi:predicted enzyme related to lactoylglutathione lyase